MCFAAQRIHTIVVLSSSCCNTVRLQHNGAYALCNEVIGFRQVRRATTQCIKARELAGQYVFFAVLSNITHKWRARSSSLRLFLGSPWSCNYYHATQAAAGGGGECRMSMKYGLLFCARIGLEEGGRPCWYCSTLCARSAFESYHADSQLITNNGFSLYALRSIHISTPRGDVEISSLFSQSAHILMTPSALHRSAQLSTVRYLLARCLAYVSCERAREHRESSKERTREMTTNEDVKKRHAV